MGTCHTRFEGNLTNEFWKSVVGYEGLYEVSNLGRIKSLPKQRGTRYFGSFILLPKISNHGYLVVTLQRNKIKTYPSVHRVVATAFHANPENKRTVNHIDGNKQNNNVENLEWNTHQENIKHSWAIGLSTSHIAHNRVISPEDVLEIKKIRKEKKYSYNKLAEMFNVSFGHIGSIVRGEKRA